MSSSTSSGGVSGCGVLALIFIVLKLVGTISWSWWWVLSPIWLPWSILLTILIAVGIIKSL